ncbi:transcriptional regulator [Polaribacter reichenbachii]|uniref:Transcriptional regulator n=1 Tax=Polaribacter reichenbachii TaxID=996801 RepID=A0A1B8U7G6_9FLAO|nr:winged helix-turn-helix domain-containing protein [Polaribacter reichenbachii]APZ46401.1 transcriptional regulator [Polaribacter reichenbachii]AUC20266.1 transcriptional regulator [Polaribacter reichenbachii]OBY67836.1 transcriptional regulator [Polaribacter reichenbachii]
MDIVFLKSDSGKPKYKQIIASIEDAIVSGVLKKGDRLPSLNKIKNQHSLSRDTVLSAFNELKNRGIIHSVVGKGYYVSTENVNIEQKVFLLFDELNSFKEDLYNSFLQGLDENIQVDIFFHHFNKDVFAKLINDNIGKYSYYVIMPANLADTEKVIDNLPTEKVYILDQVHKSLSQYSAIYQNFEKDIFKGLSLMLMNIVKYEKVILVFSEEKQPKGILKGFQSFCNQYNITSEVIPSMKKRVIEKGEVYIVLEDKNLIRIIKNIKEKKLTLAKDIAIVSVNDNMLKEIVEGGITTISTDFKLMGKRLAEMILNKEQVKIENPSSLILRKSI